MMVAVFGETATESTERTEPHPTPCSFLFSFPNGINILLDRSARIGEVGWDPIVRDEGRGFRVFRAQWPSLLQERARPQANNDG